MSKTKSSRKSNMLKQSSKFGGGKVSTDRKNGNTKRIKGCGHSISGGR